MPRSVLGLNIGSRFIKAVELRSKRGGIEVAAIGIAPTPEAAIAAGEILQPDVLIEALRELIRDAGIRAKDTVVTIAGQASVVVRVTEVPKMSHKEFVSTMALEIEREVPFDPGSIRKDYVMLRDMDEVEEGGTVPVLYAAVRSDVIDTYIDVLLKAGLNPVAIDVEPLAVVRALIDLPVSIQGDGEFGPNDLVVIVNIGAEGSDVVVVHGGVIAFPRILPIGSEELTLAISDALAMDKLEAERMKQEVGTAWVEELMAEISRRPPAARESETMPVDELGLTELDMGGLEHMTDGGTPTGGEEKEVAEEITLGLGLGEESEEQEETKPFAQKSEAGFELEVERQSTFQVPSEERSSEEKLPFEFELEQPAVSESEEQPTEILGGERSEDVQEFELPELDLSLIETIEQPETQEVELEEVSIGEPKEAETVLVGGFDLDFGEDIGVSEGLPTELMPEGAQRELTGATLQEQMRGGFDFELETDVGPSKPVSAEELTVEGLETEKVAVEEQQPSTPVGAATFVGYEETLEAAPTVTGTARYIFEAIENRLHDLATEIVRSVEYYTSRVPSAEVKLVYIIGGGARLNGLDKFLEYQLGVPVKVGNPFRYLELAPVISRYGQAYIDDIAPYMVVALGAALRELL
ncbi:MAG: type IV pilus assembly protein PilM [Armatimonadetes bacterium]|nr:type IV pilus assembly protein PilM [Armatimonadota bacterium]